MCYHFFSLKCRLFLLILIELLCLFSHLESGSVFRLVSFVVCWVCVTELFISFCLGLDCIPSHPIIFPEWFLEDIFFLISFTVGLCFPLLLCWSPLSSAYLLTASRSSSPVGLPWNPKNQNCVQTNMITCFRRSPTQTKIHHQYLQ